TNFLWVMLPLLFFSCQKDDDFRAPEREGQTVTGEVNLKKLRLNEITDHHVIERLNLSRNRSFSDPQDYRPIQGTGLSVRVNDIVFLENSTYQSYTFGVKDVTAPDRTV